MENIFLKPPKSNFKHENYNVSGEKINRWTTSRLDASEEKISDFGGMAIIQVETGGEWFFKKRRKSERISKL